MTLFDDYLYVAMSVDGSTLYIPLAMSVDTYNLLFSAPYPFPMSEFKGAEAVLPNRGRLAGVWSGRRLQREGVRRRSKKERRGNRATPGCTS